MLPFTSKTNPKHHRCHRSFSWQSLLIVALLTTVTGWLVNGPVWGTAALMRRIPSVTIPDLTPFYIPSALPGFFQKMGESGRQAYIVINNLDFLFIFCYSLFGVVALGVLFGLIMKNKSRAHRLALFGLIPGLLDLIESSLFRLIVSDPYQPHVIASTIASIITPLKFAAINLGLVAIILLSFTATFRWYKRRSLHN